MNFLGHAYIARNFPQLIPGNFAGDSYKGKIEKFNELPSEIYNGIRLHRFIDDFTDNSEYIIEVCRIFQKGGVQKVGFIASDIILDHHLSRDWLDYSSRRYDDFVNHIYTQTEPFLEELHPEFQWLYKNLKKHGWLYDYPTVDGITKIMGQFSRRIGFENDLLKTIDLYQDNQPKIDELYTEFLSSISDASEQFIIDNLGEKP